MPNSALQADGASIHCMGRTVSSGKVKGGGVCFLVFGPVYIPPHGNVKNALDKNYAATNTLETKFPEALFIAAGDFNQTNLKQAVFKCSVENLDEYASTVMDFISKCVEDCIPKKSIQVFVKPNRKLWMNQEIYSLLKTRHAAFKSGDKDQYRKSRYDLHKAIREAKRQYQTKLDAQTYQKDSCHLWQGLNDITGYKTKQCKIVDNDTSLPDMLNVFNAWFEQNTTSVATPDPTAPDTPVPSVTASEVRSDFLGVNPRKVMSPD
eukprot:g40440.t1